MLVSAVSSLEGQPSLAVGNAIGSNIANVGLILGLTGLIYPLTVERITLKREFPVLAAIMLLTLVVMGNLYLSRLDGLILAGGLLCLVGGMVALGLAKGEDDPMTSSLADSVPEGMSSRRAGIWILVGIALLPLSAHILVTGAVTLALIAGVSEAVIGLTVVALGTSLPELAAAAASAFRKEDDLTIGNILGSNMFNLLGVLGIAALVHPLVIDEMLLYRDVSVMFAITLGLFLMIWRREGPGLITRPAAGALLLTYLVYQTVVITTAVAG